MFDYQFLWLKYGVNQDKNKKGPAGRKGGFVKMGGIWCVLTIIRCHQKSSEGHQRVIRVHPEVLQRYIRDTPKCIRRHQLQGIDFVLSFCAIIIYIQN